MLTRDPAAMEAILHDPLVHQRVTVRWGMEILATIRFVNNHPRDIRQPLLMLHGDADRVNTIGGTLAFFAEVTHPDKTLRVYPGSRHEPHNDLDASQVVADLHDWLESHLPE